jgi:hypothetical protein
LWLRNAPAVHDRDDGTAGLPGASRKTASPAGARQQQTGDIVATLVVASARPRTPLPEQSPAVNEQREEWDLPDDPVDTAAISEDVDRMVNSYSRRQVREAQDRVTSRWPRYADVREQYVRELASTLDLEHFSCDQMIDLAVAFRESFWAQGGDLAAHSYRLAYRARALLEQARQHFPDNLSILDELIETIQSTDLTLRFDPGQKRDVPNEAARQDLQNLRQQQWALVQSQRQAGRALCMQDFVCACDLAYLLQAKNTPASKQVVRWLRDTDDGTWHQYQKLLQEWEDNLDRGYNLAFHIYPLGPGKYRYERRLPSFRGPADR